MKKHTLLINKFIVIFLILQNCLANASESFDNTPDINQRIQKLEEEIILLKNQQKIQNEKNQTATEKIANVEFGQKGLKITSPDKNHELSLRGYFQLDSRHFLKDDSNISKNNDFLARRLRPILEIKSGNASFRLMPEFAGTTTRIFDAHADYKLFDALQFRVGKFKTPVSLERLQSAADIFFVERGHPNNLAPSRDFGFMIYGHLVPETLEYQLGVFNGNQDLGNSDGDDDDNKDIAGRIFAHPFHSSDIMALKGLGLGIAGSIGNRDGSTSKTILGTYKSPGQQDFFRYRSDTFADGRHWRLYPQAYWYFKNVGFLAEYALSHQAITNGTNHAEVQHNAWQLAGSYMLTEENVNFRGGVKPHQDFDFTKSGIGAWEVTARIGQTDVDDKVFPLFADNAVATSKALSYGGGLNWYLNENLKLMTNYDFTQFDNNGIGGNYPDEHAVFTRTQYRF